MLGAGELMMLHLELFDSHTAEAHRAGRFGSPSFMGHDLPSGGTTLALFQRPVACDP
jgi:hypothetical protein